MGKYEDAYKKLFEKNFIAYYGNVRHGFEKQDQLIVWVAGLNIAAVALLISQKDKLHYPYWVLKASILAFCLSILSAVTYRVISIMLLVRWAIVAYLLSFDYTKVKVDLTEAEVEKEKAEFTPKHEKYINNLLGISEKAIQKNKEHPKKMFPLAYTSNFFHKLTFILFGIAIVILCLFF